MLHLNIGIHVEELHLYLDFLFFKKNKTKQKLPEEVDLDKVTDDRTKLGRQLNVVSRVLLYGDTNTNTFV